MFKVTTYLPYNNWLEGPVVIYKEKGGILKTMLTEAEKLLMMSMVILMGIIFRIARRNLRRKSETEERSLHLKDGMVRHYTCRTKIFGITITSQRTTTISKLSLIHI